MLPPFSVPPPDPRFDATSVILYIFMMYTPIIPGSQCVGSSWYILVKWGVSAQWCGFWEHSGSIHGGVTEESWAKSVNSCLLVHDVKCYWRFMEVRSDIKQRNHTARPIPPTTGLSSVPSCQHRAHTSLVDSTCGNANIAYEITS